MKQQIQQLFAEILEKMEILNAGIVVEVPENPTHGDYTTSVAMTLAARLKAPPVKIAQQIVDTIKKHQNESGRKNLSWLKSVTVAGPGFINLWLSDGYFGSKIDEVLKQADRYGSIETPAFLTENSLVEQQNHSEQNVKSGAVASKTKKGTKSSTKSGTKYADVNADAGKEGKGESTASFGKQKIETRDMRLETSKTKNQSSVHSPQSLRIMVEFAHPNTHKAFHIGHLRNITTGESIVRLLSAVGNDVIRVNYQGDVGMHIAKALYGILEIRGSRFEIRDWQDAKNLSVQQRVEYLGEMYAAGSKAFEEDEKAQVVIKDINALIYASAQQYAREVGRDPGTTDYLSLVKNHVYPLQAVYALWKETRQWSLDYFDTVYKRVGTVYDRFYFESECLSGVDIAKQAVKDGVLKESDGAIILDGKPHGIDTRVFVNSLGLPTYEGKELALSRMETAEFGDLDRIIHVVGPEQASFFTVTFKAEELLGLVKPGMQHHLVYGWVKLKHGKMSSRSGKVVLGEWLLDEAKKEILRILEKNASLSSSGLTRGSALEKTRKTNTDSRLRGNDSRGQYSDAEKEAIAEACAVAAVKYAFLKVGTNQEIAFDLKESVSFEGDSGPYIQYTYARCKSVLRKAQATGDRQQETGSASDMSHVLGHMSLNSEERIVVRRIAQFPDVVADAAARFSPSTLCTYLFQLAQEFNVLYARHAILATGNRRQATGESQRDAGSASDMSHVLGHMSHRIAITAATAQVLSNGLYLLGIPVIERM
jgi:arginyl-tRNA synthetase